MSINEIEIEENIILYERLKELLLDGNINNAENLLFDEFNPEDKEHIIIALNFYSKLNDLDDSYLERNNFTRKEIKEGLKDIIKIQGIELANIN